MSMGTATLLTESDDSSVAFARSDRLAQLAKLEFSVEKIEERY